MQRYGDSDFNIINGTDRPYSLRPEAQKPPVGFDYSAGRPVRSIAARVAAGDKTLGGIKVYQDRNGMGSPIPKHGLASVGGEIITGSAANLKSPYMQQ